LADSGLTMSTEIISLASNGSHILAGTHGSGLFVSGDYGRSWSLSDKGLVCKTINSLAFAGSNIFAGIGYTWANFDYYDGMYMSTDNGGNWFPVNKGLSNIRINAIALQGDELYAGTYGHGAYTAEISGSDCIPLDTGLVGDCVYSMAVSSNCAYAGAWNAKLYKTTDSGSSWSLLNTGIYKYLNIRALAVSGNNVYAGTDYDSGSGGLFISNDNGNSWHQSLYGIYANAIAARGNNVYVGTYSDAGGLLLSSDNGASWSLVDSSMDCYCITAIALSDSNIYTGGMYGCIFRSTDNGITWENISSLYINSTINSLAVYGDNILAGTCNGGVYLSINKGNDWLAFKTGLTSDCVYSIAINDSDIYAGTTDAGVWKRKLSDILYADIEEETSSASILLFPNPATDELNVVFPEGSEIEIMNIEGQIIKRLLLDEVENTVDISGLAKGVYFIKIENSAKVWVKKFVKE
jgi:photosystem II stability/assembly factor-like uncharacterized protein